MYLFVDSILIGMCALSILLGGLLYSKGHFGAYRATGFVSLFLLFAWTVLRSLLAGHAPFAGAYEAFLFFSFLYIVKLEMTAFSSAGTVCRSGTRHPAFNLPPLAFLLIAAALPQSLKESKTLVPALDSPWMYVHVPSFFLGYSSLAVAFIQALRRKEFIDETKAAFFFMTLGLLTGAFWADAAWGRFWSWDPKETWALISWIWTALVLHEKPGTLRFVYLALAVFSVVFTFLGVMFLIPGLHSYM